MSNENAKNLIEGMSLEEVKALRTQATKRIKLIRQRQKRIEVYIPAEYQDAFEVAVKWAYEMKLIKKPTKWSFAKLVVVNAIETINNEINRKNTLNAEGTAGMPSEIIPSENSSRDNLGALIKKLG